MATSKIDQWLAALETPEASKRLDALEAIKQIGESSEPLVRRLMAIAKSDDNRFVVQAAQAALEMPVHQAIANKLPPAGSLPPVPKFEYCELEVVIGGPLSGVKGNLTTFRANGNHKETSGDYGILMAELGETGWELVASSARIETGLSNKHRINYVFKRMMSNM